MRAKAITPAGNTDNGIFILWLLTVHMIYFILALYFRHIVNGDSAEYVYEAVNIKNSGWFYSGNPALPVDPQYMTLRPPLYPLFLCAVYFFGINNWVVLLVQMLLSMFNMLFARNTFYLLNWKKKYDWPLLILIVLFPSQFIYTNTLAPEILLQTFTWIYIRSMLMLLHDFRWKWLLISSLALSFGMLVKPVLYPLSLIHVAGMLIWIVCLKKHLTMRLLLGLIPFLCWFGYGVVNQSRTGTFHFTSIQSFNAIYYYHHYFSYKNGAAEGEAFLNKERTHIDALGDFGKQYRYAERRGAELLKREGWSYVRYHLLSSALFFIQSGKGEMDLFLGKMTLGRLYSGNTAGPAKYFKEQGLKGLSSYIRNNPVAIIALLVVAADVFIIIGVIFFGIWAQVCIRYKLFIFFLFMYFALITGPIVNAHYVLPVSLLLSGVSVIGWYSAANKIKKKSTA